MTDQTFNESGMTFGPYPPGHCFHIEDSSIYKKIMENVKIAEFLLLHPKIKNPPTIFIIEAKSSSPHPRTQPDFDIFIGEIRDKLTHAFSLCMAVCLGRHGLEAKKELPDNFQILDLAKAEFRLVLIIKDHEDDWLDPIKDALIDILHPFNKIWSLSPTPLYVLNDALAREFGLIT